MTTWTFGDGTVLSSGGKVEGSKAAAVMLREGLVEGAARARVQVLPAPSDPITVDESSDYLLHLFAIDVARRARTGVATEYELDDEDAPAFLRGRLRAAREARSDTPIGTVH